jgi:hypothetical protein
MLSSLNSEQAIIYLRLAPFLPRVVPADDAAWERFDKNRAVTAGRKWYGKK